MIAKAIYRRVKSVVGTDRQVGPWRKWYPTVIEESVRRWVTLFDQAAVFVRYSYVVDICRDSKEAVLADLDEAQRLAGRV